ncbi:MAG: DNA internalization-related competence protein ComEC/Rec2 [Magnetococcus sp. MYC-9]
MDIHPKSEPLAWPTVVLFCQIAAITLCSSGLEEAWLPLTVMACTVAGVSVHLWLRKGGGWLPVWVGVLLGLAAMAWISPAQAPLPAALINQSVVLEGRIVERQDRPDSLQMILDQGVVTAATNPLPAPVPVAGNIQLTLRLPSELAALPGDRIRVQTRLKPVDSTRNPGGFDYARHQRQRGIHTYGFSNQAVERLTSAAAWSWNRYRQTLSQWIFRELPPTAWGLAEAMMVGKSGFLGTKLTEDLMVSGTYHLVAISGLQVGLVAGWSFFLLRLLLVLWIPLSRQWDVKRAAALLTLLPTVAYAFLAGWSISTQRATLMAGCLLLAVALGRARQLWRVLILAAMLILAWQPWQLFSPGFQLSFLSVMGLIYFMPLLQRGQGWKKQLLGLLLTTLVASLVTTPVAAHHFHRASPHALLANLLAVPWVSVVSTPLGLLAVIFHELHPPLGDLLLHGMGASLEPYRLFIAWISALPGAWQRLPGPSLVGLGLSLSLCALAGLVGMAGWRRWRWGLFAASWPALLWPHPAPPADRLQLTVLDVGQAQSVVLHTPRGGWSVFDAGGFVSPRFNPGEAFTSSYLWHQGVKHLQRVVVSHPQQDHMAGVEQLLRNFKVDALWLGDFAEAEQENQSYADLIARAEQQGVAIQRIRQRIDIEEGLAHITVLPPLPEALARNDNDRSLVVEIAFETQRFLIPGDATACTEKWLLSQQTIQPLTLLVAPHHGSKSSSTSPFVQASQARHVVFSVGRYNPHHHPNREVWQRWQASDARLWRTDQQGAVILSSDGRTVQVRAAAEARPSLVEALFP